ncbi:hypothetical protein NQZ68_036463 [Dissostichus eleginoides]|nr:hypothetical protein NQZ68_036451 [Dissostichus eleginoides]KAI9545476.1 hypothetical protein NQZ68_036463 [Dissostichus eleginoides]
MAELGSTSSIGRKRKTVMELIKKKKKGDTRRSQTRVNIGVAFQRWRLVMEHNKLKSDAMVALFLLDSYERDVSGPTQAVKAGGPRPPPPAVSTSLSEELSGERGICRQWQVLPASDATTYRVCKELVDVQPYKLFASSQKQ